MQLVPPGFASFPCPACGVALPATMAAGMQIPCPACRTTITVPLGGGPTQAQAQAYQQWAMVHGNTAAALADAAAPSGAGRAFASTSSPIVVEDGRGGVVVVGAQVSAQAGWWLRAIDPATGQVRWDALAGSRFQVCPDARTLVGRGGRIYLEHEGVLTALDAGSGQVLWRARLSGRVCTDPDRACWFGDETELTEVGAVVLVRTEDEVLTAFDRATGAPVWQRRTDRAAAVAGEVVKVEADGGAHELLRAADGARLARFERCDGSALVAGGVLLATSQQVGDDDVDGVAFVDLQGQPRWFVAAEDRSVDDDDCCAVGDRIFVCVSGSSTRLLPLSVAGGAPRPGFFARLFGAKGPATHPLGLGDAHVKHLRAAGDALVVEAQYGDGRRIVVLDAATLAIRHDSGMLTDESVPGVRLLPGLVVYTFAADHDAPVEVRAIDAATGAVRWQTRYPDLYEIALRAGRLVMACRGGRTDLLDPGSGAVTGTFAG